MSPTCYPLNKLFVSDNVQISKMVVLGRKKDTHKTDNYHHSNQMDMRRYHPLGTDHHFDTLAHRTLKRAK